MHLSALLQSLLIPLTALLWNINLSCSTFSLNNYYASIILA